MSEYKVKTGWNVALGSLVTVTPQPRDGFLKATRRVDLPSGLVFEDGLYVELIFDVIQNAATYRTLLHQFGVRDNLASTVTVYIRDRKFEWVRMNGWAVQPRVGEDVRYAGGRPRQVTLLVRGLKTPTS